MAGQHLQHPHGEAHRLVHLILLDHDAGEAAAARDAGDGASAALLGVGLDHGSGRCRVVGVADVHRNARRLHREDGGFVQHGRAHVGQLPQLRVGDHVDGRRVVHDARVAAEQAGHVRPVLVEVGCGRARNDCAGDVRAAAAEGAHLAVRHAAVEAREHCAGNPLQNEGQFLLRGLGVKAAILTEEDVVLGIDQRPIQIGRHHHGDEVLAPTSGVVPIDLAAQLRLDVVQLRIQIQIQPQLAHDLAVALPHQAEAVGEIQIVLRRVAAAVQKVGDLDVVPIALARCGHHHIAPRRIAVDDRRTLAELRRIRQRAAAEFYRLEHPCVLRQIIDFMS